MRDNLGNAFDLGFFFALRLVSPTLCSGFGAWLGPRIMPRLYPVSLRRTRENFERLFPDRAPAELDRMMRDYMESQGRQMAEYSALPRLARQPGHIRHVGVGYLKERCATGPVIFMGLHTCNWEVLSQCMIDMGITMSLNYDPPVRRARHWIVRHVRLSGGLNLLPPGRQAVRPALQLLESGGHLLVFCDEGFNRRVRAPFFGRPATLESNYALVARLARKTGALICPVYLTRDRGTYFTMTVLEPFRLADESSLMDDVARLNAIVEPVIRDYAPQWYFVNDRID
ncbi:lysophospholipid acyltransferase family protein [Gluconacetobacter takamatsuzukensis]|uniref:lysophospholipid acyltransferase family protein n=1 Tax=Gluconacetobacter takamatsuzukensis TaxID=1286190 RepID=UPI001C7EE688